MTDRDEMEAALEAVLFVAGEPVSNDRLLGLFEADERDAAAAALEAVLARYDGPGRGVMVDRAAGGVRLVTRPELGGWLKRFFESSGGSKLSMAALETLAIVAYRQPVTAPEIQELRSVNPSGVLKTLLERRMVRIAGRKEVVGKPFLYATTREFLVHFGLDSLKDLPPLEDFEEVFGEEAAGGVAAAVLDATATNAQPAPPTDAEERFDREVAALADADEADDADDADDEETGEPADAELELAEPAEEMVR